MTTDPYEPPTAPYWGDVPQQPRLDAATLLGQRVGALLADLHAQLAEQRREHAEAQAELRAELAEVRAQLRQLIERP